MELYSYRNQEPSPLPFRVTLDSGETRTSLDELSSEDLNDLGFSGPIIKPDYNNETQKLVWNGLQYEVIDLSQEELDLISGMKESMLLNERRKNLNYVLFWNELIKTSFYKKIRVLATQSLSANTICTEIISIFSDAKSGNPNKEEIQKYISIIFLTFNPTLEDAEELRLCMENSNLSLEFNLPDKQYLEKHRYNEVENTIEFIPESTV